MVNTHFLKTEENFVTVENTNQPKSLYLDIT